MKIKHTEAIEEGLLDTEELNQTILDNAFDANISMDDAGKIIRASLKIAILRIDFVSA